MDLSPTIIPKSDQLNADDLISGPLTIRINAVKAGSKEQPVSIHFEGDDGRPYKPGKSMRRVLVSIWGKDSKTYIGRRLTLYRDPEVRFGKDQTGGIRISHASHIHESHTMPLTVTRGQRRPFTVEPLAEESAQPQFQPPAGWQGWTLEERGLNRAGAGTTAFRAWWKTLSKAESEPLKSKAESEWKQIAEAADKAQQSTP